MSKCIKCGAEIPDGELFCQECSLNAGSSMFEEAQATRYKAPPGKMQTPVPVAHTRMEAHAAHPVRRKKPKNRGLKAALFLMTLLFLGSVGFLFSQYGRIQVEKTRLRTKEADIALRLAELDDLRQEIEEKDLLLEEAKQKIADKESEIKELMHRLSESQSSQNQGEYDLTQSEQELDRLNEENLQLLKMADDLSTEITELKTDLAVLESESREAQEKADFMDEYVVFVEKDGKCYHSYDCQEFSKTNFWAYSRGLAEYEGYTPCPICQGKTE